MIHVPIQTSPVADSRLLSNAFIDRRAIGHLTTYSLKFLFNTYID